jgi:hypothetical protein
MPLGRKSEPFDHSEWIYELKYDGFRALAAVEYGRCTLLSRNGHPFTSFSELASRIGYALVARSVVSLAPARLRRFSRLFFALFLSEFCGRGFAALATQLHSGGVLLFGHEVCTFDHCSMENQMGEKCYPVST